jgi:hypothetical protein
MDRRIYGAALGIFNNRNSCRMTQKENNLMRVIMLAVGKCKDLKLFRNNTGQAWQGSKKIFEERNGRRVLILYDPRPIDAGLCNGSSDLIGWKTVTVTQDMVGKKVALFTAVEVKSEIKSVASAAQINFLTVIREMGGVAGLARSTDEARRLLGVNVKEEEQNENPFIL